MDILKDNPLKLFWKYLIPSIGGALVVTIYSFIDTIAVGQSVGANGTAAIAVITPLFQIAAFVGILCGTGGSVLFSIAKGEKNTEKANACYTASLIIMIIFTVLLWAFLWFFRVDIMRFFGADEVVLPYALKYGNCIIAGFPFMLFSMYLPFFLRNDNAPNLAFVSMTIGGVFNIFGDWFFVFPMNMGIFGAGLATIIGTIIQTLIQISYFFTKKCSLNIVKPNNIIKAFIKTFSCGFGAAFIEIAMIINTVLLNNLIMYYANAVSLAVYGYLLTIVALCQHIFLGVSQAAQPVISTNFGAGNTDRIESIFKYSIITTILFSVVFTGVGMLFPKEITKVFVKETPEIMIIAPHILRIYFLVLPFLGFNILVIIYLQSIHKEKKAALITLLRGIIINSLLLLILPMLLKADGIWWGVVMAEFIVAIISAVFLYQSKAL